jgi:hypothetical protein
MTEGRKILYNVVRIQYSVPNIAANFINFMNFKN